MPIEDQATGFGDPGVELQMSPLDRRFCKIPNAFFDYWMCRLGAVEQAVWLCGWRLTRGFGRESGSIDVARIAKQIGLKSRAVRYALNRLEKRGLLTRSPRVGRPSILTFLCLEPVHSDAGVQRSSRPEGLHRGSRPPASECTGTPAPPCTLRKTAAKTNDTKTAAVAEILEGVQWQYPGTRLDNGLRRLGPAVAATEIVQALGEASTDQFHDRLRQEFRHGRDPVSPKGPKSERLLILWAEDEAKHPRLTAPDPVLPATSLQELEEERRLAALEQEERRRAWDGLPGAVRKRSWERFSKTVRRKHPRMTEEQHNDLVLRYCLRELRKPARVEEREASQIDARVK